MPEWTLIRAGRFNAHNDVEVMWLSRCGSEDAVARCARDVSSSSQSRCKVKMRWCRFLSMCLRNTAGPSRACTRAGLSCWQSTVVGTLVAWLACGDGMWHPADESDNPVTGGRQYWTIKAMQD